MHATSDDDEATIAIVPGPDGAEFDRAHLRLPVGAVTICVNQTETVQMILPDTVETRRVMTLAPVG